MSLGVRIIFVDPTGDIPFGRSDLPSPEIDLATAMCFGEADRPIYHVQNFLSIQQGHRVIAGVSIEHG